MSAYIAPGLIPEVRRAIISDKIIMSDVNKKQITKRSTIRKKQTRPYGTAVSVNHTQSEINRRAYQAAYREANRAKVNKYSREYMKKKRNENQSTKPT